MLPADLRRRLVEALLKVPGIGNRNRRDELLANLPPGLVDGLNRDDTARTDWTLVVTQLDRVGRLTDTGERPLVIVAQAARPYLEGTEAGRGLVEVVRALEDGYGRGGVEPPPAAPAPPPATVDARLPEAILFGDERVPYQFVERALAAARGVVRLVVPRRVAGSWQPASIGTGWVAAPGLVVTNHHVIAARSAGQRPATDDECRAQAAATRAWFDYHVEGGPRDERAVAALVWSSARLDYAIVRLADGAGRAPLAIAPRQPVLAQGDRLNIVQHPRGGPLVYAIRSNHYVGTAGAAEPHLLRYLTDTESGSSGAPVFGDNWKVVAVHHAAMPVPPQTHGDRTTYVNNEGIAIHAILADLPAALRDEIAAAQGWSDDAAHA